MADFDAFLLSGLDTAGPEREQATSYSYWPVDYLNGDPTVISNVPAPLSGVQYSELARGVGELRATLQLADDEVRATNPWEKFVPRKTGIVVVRSVTDPDTGQLNHDAVWHGILWQAPTDPATGRMELLFQTVESLWARRLITGPPPVGQRDASGNLLPSVTWSQADQAQIVRDLLNPLFFSQLGVAAGQFPGWINVEAPVANMGVPRDLTYRRGQETNLLQAHQDRSSIINGYEWRTSVRVLSGTNAYNATSFRLQFIWGYPRLGRSYLDDVDIPTFNYQVDGRGNVVNIKYAYDGTGVSNMMWGTGAGIDDDALRVWTSNSSDWTYGFLATEGRYSNSDVIERNTLQQQNDAQLLQGYANERFISALTLRGDLQPYYRSYLIGDDCLVLTDDWTWPNNPDGSRGVQFVSRIMGWKVTPPEGNNSEKLELVLGGRQEV